MTRLRTRPDPSRLARLKRAIRNFDDNEADETILSLGFLEPRNAPGAGTADQPVTCD
jgi:hypothetical protein